jgi:hypothetical protein
LLCFCCFWFFVFHKNQKLATESQFRRSPSLDNLFERHEASFPSVPQKIFDRNSRIGDLMHALAGYKTKNLAEHSVCEVLIVFVYLPVIPLGFEPRTLTLKV